MASNVVSIRVEGFSITIVDGNLAIEQTQTEVVAVPQVAGTALPGFPGDSGKGQEAQGPEAKRAHVHDLMAADACAPNGAVLANEENGSTISGRVDDSGLDAEAIGLVTNPPPDKSAWSAEEIRQLRALHPTHSAGAIADKLGRPFNSVRSKIEKLGLKRNGPPKVTLKPTPREANSAPKPRSLSAAVTEACPRLSVPVCSVSLFDHHPGQCRWIVSDVWPAVYCGAPVIGCSSWCVEHFGRVFTEQRNLNGTHRRRGRLKSALFLT